MQYRTIYYFGSGVAGLVVLAVLATLGVHWIPAGAAGLCVAVLAGLDADRLIDRWREWGRRDWH